MWQVVVYEYIAYIINLKSNVANFNRIPSVLKA